MQLQRHLAFFLCAFATSTAVFQRRAKKVGGFVGFSRRLHLLRRRRRRRRRRFFPELFASLLHHSPDQNLPFHLSAGRNSGAIRSSHKFFVFFSFGPCFFVWLSVSALDSICFLSVLPHGSCRYLWRVFDFNRVRRRALLLRSKPWLPRLRFCPRPKRSCALLLLALISLSDKTDLAFLGKGIQELGYTVVSTGGTASTLENAGLSVTKVEQLTCFPEMLDGHVKTLHPHIHKGIFARRDQQHRMEALGKHRIGTCDVVVVNLYPFYDKATSVVDLKMELRMLILVVLPRSELRQRIIRMS